MNIQATEITGLFIIEYNNFIDKRGTFLKYFNQHKFSELGLSTDFKECFFTTSSKNVIRGMHFQIPPAHQTKIVNIIYGKVIDVILDIRKKSPTYLKYLSIELDSHQPRGVYIPPGVAHGFGALTDNAILNYMTSSTHVSELDTGIKWNSFGFDWPIAEPIISDRDAELTCLPQFNSPFNL